MNDMAGKAVRVTVERIGKVPRYNIRAGVRKHEAANRTRAAGHLDAIEAGASSLFSFLLSNFTFAIFLPPAVGCIGNYILDASASGCIVDGVTYTIREFSKSQVDKAGARLTRPKASVEKPDIEKALEIINNFRSAHNLPLLIFRVDLTERAHKIDLTATVAQRLKRLPAIEAKLRRLSSMRLTQMEDIGGCRAVVRSADMVRRLSHLYEKSRMKHECLHLVNYLTEPRETGYRGIHLIYAYRSDAKPASNGLKIEIQLRSRQQHAWATAVETVDAFTGQGIKDGSGEVGWQRFFALMGTYIAHKEGGNSVPNTPSDPKHYNPTLPDARNS